MARGYTQRIKKCQLKSDRFNYKRDIVGIISVTRVSRPHNTRFTKNKNRERSLLLDDMKTFNGTWVHATNQKCQLKSDRFNYKRDSVGIISVTRVSRLHKNTFCIKTLDIKQ